ncbi:hypothetical protein [Cupriavidus sp. SW-Y-13]|uniref:hypothetical protein n=1 Tax=Cupriavidus sp. SW-Y-13 TaxID=2653854 RepID=UPI001366110B|nr:hypothetical protein [Cupriavidus sp. SW-Y-13]MWL88124.1 hypothetical protein [Cupriavidus sp. SW-Y-13]
MSNSTADPAQDLNTQYHDIGYNATLFLVDHPLLAPIDRSKSTADVLPYLLDWRRHRCQQCGAGVSGRDWTVPCIGFVGHSLTTLCATCYERTKTRGRPFAYLAPTSKMDFLKEDMYYQLSFLVEDEMEVLQDDNDWFDANPHRRFRAREPRTDEEDSRVCDRVGYYDLRRIEDARSRWIVRQRNAAVHVLPAAVVLAKPELQKFSHAMSGWPGELRQAAVDDLLEGLYDHLREHPDAGHADVWAAGLMRAIQESITKELLRRTGKPA